MVFCPSGVLLLYSINALTNSSSSLKTLFNVTTGFCLWNVETFGEGSLNIPVEVLVGCVDDIGGKGSFGNVVGVSSSRVKSSRRLTSFSVLLYSSSSSTSGS
jgi:hypothetical protein